MEAGRISGGLPGISLVPRAPLEAAIAGEARRQGAL
jgi:hypothetical protein